MRVDVDKWFEKCVYCGGEIIRKETKFGVTWTCKECGHKESVTYIKSITNPEPEENDNYTKN